MIIPGILEKDFEDVLYKVYLIDDLCDLIQIDVADGVLVDGKTFGDLKKLDTLDSIAKFNIHLMVENPVDYLDEKIKRATSISTQIETPQTSTFIKKARNLGYKVGLSVNAEVPTETIFPYLRQINYVQFMGVTPGRQGNRFNEKVLPKIRDFKRRYMEIPIWVDGGINTKTLPLVLHAGADNVVIGSGIFRKKDPRNTLINLKEKFNQ